MQTRIYKNIRKVKVTYDKTLRLTTNTGLSFYIGHAIFDNHWKYFIKFIDSFIKNCNLDSIESNISIDSILNNIKDADNPLTKMRAEYIVKNIESAFGRIRTNLIKKGGYFIISIPMVERSMVESNTNKNKIYVLPIAKDISNIMARNINEDAEDILAFYENGDIKNGVAFLADKIVLKKDDDIYKFPFEDIKSITYIVGERTKGRMEKMFEIGFEQFERAGKALQAGKDFIMKNTINKIVLQRQNRESIVLEQMLDNDDVILFTHFINDILDNCQS